MAIAIEAYTVIALRSRIEEKYEGGVEALSKAAPNQTALADDDLWRCAFMASADAESFLAELQHVGLNVRQGPDPDVVSVSEFDLSVSPYCEWLQVGQWEKGVIGWLTGTTPRKIVAREGWSPERGSGFQFVSSVDDGNMEFLRYDGNVAVYFDKQHRKEVYIGRTSPDADEVFKRACQVMIENCFEPGPRSLTVEVTAKVLEAIADLEKIAVQFPDQWRVFFFIGKGNSAIGELDRAYESLRRAYELEAETESVPRELAGICLELGKAGEAVQIGEKAAALQPDNPQTLGNLACAYLIDGRLQEAEATIRAALTIDAHDETNRLLQSVLHEICAGRRPQPRHIRDLTEPVLQSNAPAVQTNDSRSPPTPIKKSTFWSRLRFWWRPR
jgi:hypothetical protein